MSAAARAVRDGVTTAVDGVATTARQAADGVASGARQAADGLAAGARQAADGVGAAAAAVANAVPTISDDARQLVFVDFNNVLRSFFHTNVLAMPYAISEAGIVLGVTSAVVLSIVCEHTTELLVRVKHAVQHHRDGGVVVYGDAARIVWGTWVPMINMAHGAVHLTSFLVFAGHNLQVALTPSVEDLVAPQSSAQLAETQPTSYALCLLLLVCLAMPLCFIKDARQLRPLSVVGNVTLLCAVGVVFAAAVQATPSGTTEIFPTVEVTGESRTIHIGPWRVDVAAAAQRWPVSLGVLVYAFTGIGTILPVERTMSAGRYVRLLRLSTVLGLGALLTFGLVGYRAYGKGTCAVITLSMPDTMLREAASQLMLLASVCYIPQHLFPCAEVLDRVYLRLGRQPEYWDTTANVARVVLVGGCAAAAYALPFYGLLSALAGGFTCTLLQLIVPPLLELTLVVKVYREQQQRQLQQCPTSSSPATGVTAPADARCEHAQAEAACGADADAVDAVATDPDGYRSPSFVAAHSPYARLTQREMLLVAVKDVCLAAMGVGIFVVTIVFVVEEMALRLSQAVHRISGGTEGGLACPCGACVGGPRKAA